MAFDPKQLEHFPMQPGVYLMKDADGKVIYVGKAKQLKVRVKQYFALSGDSRPMVPFLVQQIAHIDTIIVPSEKEALLLENTLIKKHQPKFNAILKDDKTFISLMINNRHPWPMLKLIRYKGKPKDDGLYFGPYTSAYAARETYELLLRLFPLRQCSDEELKRRTRPCLLYSIKRCCAPCVHKCTKEEYESYVKGAVRFLKGHDKEILRELYAEMEKASEQLQYEKAASLLKTIRQLEHVVHSDQIVAKVGGKDADAINLYRQGEEVMLAQLLFREGNLVGSEHFSFSSVLEDDEELITSFLLQHYQFQDTLPKEILLPFPLKEMNSVEEILCERLKAKLILAAPQKGDKKALVDLAGENAKVLFIQEKNQQEIQEKQLLDLQETLKLNRYPQRIECFDTSHIAGDEAVAAMVAFTNGEKETKRYRLFRIKTASFADDYRAIREALTRRLVRAKEEDDLPDLIIIDGGKGHLNTALEVFKNLDIASVDVIGVAKESGRHDKGVTQEQIFLPGHHDPILLNPRSSLLFLLQKIRDEAHRRAITFHRERRGKKNLVSKVDSIPGIGPVKRTRLLKHFGSFEKIRKATREELSEVQGLTEKDIENILRFKISANE
ncbi:MAG: excinuclease ABC subunit UvrC [Parachlamydiales bacterium]|nr:excinuclease ABC subunit UvrC [Candidatus Acheromyda pituitae]